MNISIGADHGGVDLKDSLVEAIREMGHNVLDRGTHGHSSVDYPDFGAAVAGDVTSGEATFGVLICTTGVGISISANKVAGIRAALVMNEDAAEFSRLHNNANVICFGQKYHTPYLAAKMARTFFDTAFDGGERHLRRVNKINAIEQHIACGNG